jgi:hypothetical protein
MKNLLILACVLFLAASCGNSKDATSTATATNDANVETENEDEKDEATDPYSNQNGDVLIATGVIRDKAADGCGFVIQMMVDANTETSTFYEPLKLPREYQEDGKLIRIEYRMSRRPSNCTMAIPIIIDKVLKL